jgi:hypothetical protein
METNSYKLSDDVIGQVAKLLQLAIITGTDVVDNLRTLKVKLDVDSGLVVPDPDYIKTFDENLTRLVATAAMVSAHDDEGEN